MVFSARIHAWLRGRDCVVFAAPFDVVLPDEPGQREDQARTVVQPDIAVICDRSRLRPWGCLGAPDWVIEILSPWTSKKDMSDKLALYQKHGVAEYWIADPGNRYIHAYRLAPGGAGRGRAYGDPAVLVGSVSAESPICPGLAIPLDEIFAAP
jgi:Uma2 family endonuclease